MKTLNMFRKLLGSIKPTFKQYYGWFGYGGSVFQWHPDLNIGFGYTPTLLHWEDWTNGIGTNLQQEVVKCVQKLKK